MIYMLTTPDHLCLEDFLTGRGASFAPHIVPLPYSTLLNARALPRGTYVFGDLERLSGRDLERAAGVWQQLAARGPGVRLLNPPLKVKQRFELLRALRQHGVNDFDVYRLDEGRSPRRFPVFVRSEQRHNGVVSDLIHDAPALEQFLEGWRARGHGLAGLILTEFSGEPDARGLYRRYAAFNIGGRIIPTDIFFSRRWEVRGMDDLMVVDEHTVAEELRYLRGNPHEAQLRAVFDLACIEYGRVDYGIVGGRVQVYEINTNPYLASGPLGGEMRAAVYEQFARDFLAALHTLKGPDGGTSLAVRPADEGQRRAALRGWAKRAVYGALWWGGPERGYGQRVRWARRLIQRGKRVMGDP
ncbi:hypothetical protein [Deinococcus aerius]|nr:hypothetical protein [Deinococcus aerius]